MASNSNEKNPNNSKQSTVRKKKPSQQQADNKTSRSTSNGSKQVASNPQKKQSQSTKKSNAQKKPATKKPVSKSTSSSKKQTGAKKTTSKKVVEKANSKQQTAKKPSSKPTATKKAANKKTSSKADATKKQTGTKKSTNKSTSKKSVSKKVSPKRVVSAIGAGATTKKVASEASDKQKARVNAQKKKPVRKLNNLEVRNSHASTKKRSSKIKFVKPAKRAQGPHIYDEAKYLKTLKKSGRKNLIRIATMFAALFVLSLIFVVKLEVTNTKRGNDLEAYAQNNYTETTSVEAKRGTIYDTNGEALAINLEVYDLRAVTDSGFECNVDGAYENCSLSKDDVDTAAKEMAAALSLDGDSETYIKERLNYGLDNEKYEVTFGSQGKNLTLSQKKALEKLDYPWLQFDAKEQRFYPYGDFASYIIGYTTQDDNGDINGALGVEKALDGQLKGQDGVETSLFDNYGIELTEAQQSAIPKIDGTDVYLTLDSVIQTYLENSMEKALSADGVSDIEYDGLFTIVMDAKTGDILAAQSYPSFDPNVREIENYTNYFTDYCFEPGSTFKAATVAAADEAGVWDDTVTEPTGSRSAATWGGATVGDWNNNVGWGNITWAQGFYFSSNTVMTYIMDAIPKDFWIDFVTNKLLIGTPVETQFIETPSCVFNPQYDLEYATSAFGQGITVNTLQLLRMYSALIEDGNMVTPHIVQTIKDSDTGETIYTDEDLEVIKNVVSKKTSAHIRELLRGVVDYDDGVNQGTGENYLGSDYDIGMKTGTAQMVGDNGQYMEDQYIYSTIAAAPIDDPQLLVYTAVIAPKDNKTNISYLAFPQYVKEVIDNSLSYMNSENRAVDVDNEVQTYRADNYVDKDMNDVDEGNIIKVGSGKITSQYPKSGQLLSDDQNVILFGTDDMAFPDVRGYTYNETVAVCNALNVTCNFSNTGTSVKSVTNESENKYKIKME